MANTQSHTQSTNTFLASAEGDTKWDATSLSYFFAAPGDSTSYVTDINVAGIFLGAPSFNALETTDAGENGIRQDVIDAMAAWERVATLPSFTASADYSSADIKIAGADGWGNTLGRMDFPGTNAKGLTGVVTGDSESQLLLSTAPFLTNRPETGGGHLGAQNALHELGHGLGLGHPHDTGGGSTAASSPSAAAAGEVVWDNQRYTVMSYEKPGWNQNSAGIFGFAVTPSAIDITAIQNMYGATSLYEGNNTYTLTDAGSTALDIDGSDGTVSIGRAFYSIWDTGGTDEIAYGGSNRSVINLNNATLSTTDDARQTGIENFLMAMENYASLPDEVKNNLEDPGYHGPGFFSMVFSSSGTMQLGGYSIASDVNDSGAKIENATGGSGDDVIVGNEADNTLTGNAGADMIAGSDGDDTIDAGDGDDQIAGGEGDDTIDGGAGDDSALFSDVCSNYDIVKDVTTGVVTISHIDGSKSDGVDTLTNVETAVFTDGKIDLTVDDPTCAPIDFIFLVDLSGSFRDDLPAFTAAAPSIFDLVKATDAEAQFAVASFVDLPVSPYGAPGDYIYQPELALTDDKAAFQAALGGLTIRSGGDGPEAQWPGLWGAANGVGLSLREESRKIILIATDADAHSAADYGLTEADVQTFLDDNAITTIGGSTADIIDPTDVGDVDPDYVGAGRDPLAGISIGDFYGSSSVIIAATSGADSFYESTLPEMVAGTVVPLSFAGDDISDAVSLGLAEIAGDVTDVGSDAADDVLVGTPNRDSLFGLGGDDTLQGLGDNDVLDGGADDDLLEGGDGDDELRGGTGDDTLDGGAGADLLNGGLGIDMLTGGADADIFEGELDGDTITDFQDVDLIRFRGVTLTDFSAILSGADTLLTISFDIASDVSLTLEGDLTGLGLTASQVGSDVEVGVPSGDLVGTDGPDNLIGTPGVDTLDAMGGDDTVSPLGGSDTVTLGDGADTLSGSPGDLYGDTVTDFSSEDSVRLAGSTIPRDGFSVTSGSAIIGVDEDGDGTEDGSFTLLGDFSSGDFMAVVDGTDTVITFHDFLPVLSDGVAIDPALVNGVINELFLTGNGTKEFMIDLRDMGYAEYDNALGVYEVDGAGNIVDAQLLFNSTNANKTASTTVSGVEDGNTLGFFLVQDAASWANSLDPADTFSFVTSGGAPANLSDGLDVLLAVNGAVSDQTVFHGFESGLNADGIVHALSGVESGGGKIIVGFEDLFGGGDRDYEDVVLAITPFDTSGAII